MNGFLLFTFSFPFYTSFSYPESCSNSDFVLCFCSIHLLTVSTFFSLYLSIFSSFFLSFFLFILV